MLFRSLALCLLMAASASHAQDSVEIRLSGTSSILGQGDTIGLMVGLRADSPLVAFTSPSAPIATHLRGFVSAVGFRSGRDFYQDPDFAFTGDGLGYGRRTLGMVEAGLAIRAGWVELAAGPSVRYRDESFVRSVLYNGATDLYEATVIDEARTDIGGVAELGVRIPMADAVAMGAHVSVRRYDEGTQVAGLGLSAVIGL